MNLAQTVTTMRRTTTMTTMLRKKTKIEGGSEIVELVDIQTE